MSMDRGCVCCSLRNDIVKALRELQTRASGRGATPYDAILLETTGLADPAPVAFTFFANSWISANYRLDSILCLVDAQHLRRVGALRSGSSSSLHACMQHHPPWCSFWGSSSSSCRWKRAQAQRAAGRQGRLRHAAEAGRKPWRSCCVVG